MGMTPWDGHMAIYIRRREFIGAHGRTGRRVARRPDAIVVELRKLILFDKTRS
jgi:hypothetical protein